MKENNIVELENFINQKEIDWLIKTIDKNNSRSMVADGTKRNTYNESRTSSTCNIPDNEAVSINIRSQIGHMLGIHPNKIESLQGQLYEVGQEFRDHYDYFTGEHYKAHCLSSGNRTDTIMIYLNDDVIGGETEFTMLGKTFTPVKGKALWWKNMIDGEVNTKSLHAGRPIKEGKKYIITAWVRENEWKGHEDSRLFNEYKNSKVNTKTFSSVEELPKLTDVGYKMLRFPKELFDKCTKTLETLKAKGYEEIYEGKQITQPGVSTLYPIWEDEKLVKEIHETLLPMMEEWSGQELEPTYIYGFREYRQGSSLILHKDRIETHHVSAIIMMDKDLECTPCSKKGNKVTMDDWSLKFIDHNNTGLDIYFDEGDMLFYESAKCEHGRPDKFKGKTYTNFYVHYKLKNIQYV